MQALNAAKNVAETRLCSLTQHTTGRFESNIVIADSSFTAEAKDLLTRASSDRNTKVSMPGTHARMCFKTSCKLQIAKAPLEPALQFTLFGLQGKLDKHSHSVQHDAEGIGYAPCNNTSFQGYLRSRRALHVLSFVFGTIIPMRGVYSDLHTAAAPTSNQQLFCYRCWAQ